MASSAEEFGPIVTLTTDFGLADAYVAEMKAAVWRVCPGARLLDVTHLVPRHDVVAGSLLLGRMIDACGPGTVHVAVVDPGVGMKRRILVAEVAGQVVVCPDNGLVTWAWRRHARGVAYELTWRPATFSSTFHGRDIMAPAAAMLACGESLKKLARGIDDPVLLELEVAAGRHGRVIHVDAYGNATTNVLACAAEGARGVRVGGKELPVCRTYGEVEKGAGLALVGSAGLVEVAVREGSAAQQLWVRVGDEVEVL